MKRCNVGWAILALLAVGWFVGTLMGTQSVEAQSPPGQAFTCSADNIGATLTLITGCNAPADNTLKRYITGIVAQSTTTTGGQFLLQYGNSARSGGAANCGTSTVSVLPSAASAIRLSAPANTGPPLMIAVPPQAPIAVVPADKDLCVLGKATDTTTLQVWGYLGQ